MTSIQNLVLLRSTIVERTCSPGVVVEHVLNCIMNADFNGVFTTTFCESF